MHLFETQAVKRGKRINIVSRKRTNLAALRENVISGANKVGSVEAGFELSRHKTTLLCQTMSIQNVRHRVVLKKRLHTLITHYESNGNTRSKCHKPRVPHFSHVFVRHCCDSYVLQQRDKSQEIKIMDCGARPS